MIKSQPITARRMLRLAALSCLKNADLTVNGVVVDIESPGDWSAPAENLPVIYIQTASETKTAVMSGMSEFNTTCSLLIKATVQNTTAESAQDDIEGLWYQIENAILGDYSIVGMSQKIPTVSSILEVKATGSEHLAGIAGSFEVECFEIFDSTVSAPIATVWPNNPAAPVSLSGVGIDVDLTNIYDATGEYPSSLFVNSVNPSPRTSGPDGRSEGAIDIPLKGA